MRHAEAMREQVHYLEAYRRHLLGLVRSADSYLEILKQRIAEEEQRQTPEGIAETFAGLDHLVKLCPKKPPRTRLK